MDTASRVTDVRVGDTPHVAEQSERKVVMRTSGKLSMKDP
jgi:hypothetical protein